MLLEVLQKDIQREFMLAHILWIKKHDNTTTKLDLQKTAALSKNTLSKCLCYFSTTWCATPVLQIKVKELIPDPTFSLGFGSCGWLNQWLQQVSTVCHDEHKT